LKVARAPGKALLDRARASSGDDPVAAARILLKKERLLNVMGDFEGALNKIRRSVDLLIELETDVPELALMAPFLVPAQLLGFHTGVKKGFNPDEPKNLSRVVILD